MFFGRSEACGGESNPIPNGHLLARDPRNVTGIQKKNSLLIFIKFVLWELMGMLLGNIINW